MNYLMDKGRGELIGGNMAGTTKAALSAEFGAIRGLRPDISRPVWHCSLSLPIGDDLSAEQWQEIAAEFCRKMDIKEDNQYCIVRHRDKAHQHVHLVVNRVSIDGGIWYADRDVYRAIEACKQLEAEKDYLQDTQRRDNSNKRYYPSYREQSRNHKGQDIGRQKVHDAIRRTIAAGSTSKLSPREFVEALQREGIGARPNISSTGRINGFSFSFGDMKYTGSKVGAKWRQLMQQLDYNPARDNAYLMQIIGCKPQDMAFSPAEFEKYREVIDRYMTNPTIAVDLRDDIQLIGVGRLMRGLKELNNAHYQQLAGLYNEQKKIWQKIRAQRPPMRLTARDMTAAAVMCAVSPALGALVLLPYIIDRLLRHNRKAQAEDIAKQISALKNEIVKNNQRRGVLKELRAENKQFMEVQQAMKQEERDIIRSNVENRINTIAKENKDFSRYIDYINQSGIRDIQLTYSELASMYSSEAWRKNNAVLRGTDAMIDAAATAIAERPENRAIYILPMVFDAISRVEDIGDRIDGQTLELAIKDFEKQDIAAHYVHAELETVKSEEKELLKQARERNSELIYQIRKQDLAEDALPEPKVNRLTGKVTLEPEEYKKLAAVYKDYHNMRDSYSMTQMQRYHDGNEKRELEKHMKEITNRLDDANRVNKSLTDRCNAAENKNVELSDKLEIIETYISDSGLDKSLADWIAAKAAIEKQMQDITRRMSDFSGDIEM